MPAWVIPAITAAAGLIGQGIAKGKDKRQLAQQGKLQELQIQGNKEMMDYGMGLQKQMWEYTGYEGQMRQMKDAGINPGLMYGMGGGGGQTVGSPNGNVTGGQAPGGSGREAEELTSMGLALSSQMGLLDAQKKNIEADTKLKEVDANKKAGVDTKEAETRINSLTQGIENQKAQEELTKVQTRIGRIDEWIKGKSKEDAAEIIMWQAEQALNQVDSLWRQNIVDKATMYDRIDTVKTELAQKALQNQLIKAQTTTEKGKPAMQLAEIELMTQQAKGIIRSGVQKWKELEISGDRQGVEQRKQEVDQWVNDAQNSTGIAKDVLEDIANAIIFKQIISPNKEHTPVQGFRK